jgi:endosialidase-like protein
MKTKPIAYLPQLLCAALSVASLLFVSSAPAQNVGVGVSNPQSKLTVNGNLAVGSGFNVAAPANGALIQGFTGIGLQTPQVPLHVNGEVYVSAGGVTGSFWNGTANIDGIQFNPIGYIGAQRASGAPLHLSKPTTFTDINLAIFSINNTPIASITVAGGTGVAYNTTSDQRLKENIRPTAKGLNELMRIQVNDFNFKSRPGRNETGFIAQQLYTVLPEAVTPEERILLRSRGPWIMAASHRY